MPRRSVLSIAPGSALVLLAMASQGSPAAAIELSPATPAVGESVTVTLAEPATSLEVTYRPSSNVVEHVVLHADSPSTTFTWQPDHAGIVSLKAGSEQKSISIRFDRFPVLGLLILLVAGTILFGGAAYAFRVLFRTSRQEGVVGYDASPARHPDT